MGFSLSDLPHQYGCKCTKSEWSFSLIYSNYAWLQAKENTDNEVTQEKEPFLDLATLLPIVWQMNHLLQQQGGLCNYG